MIRCTFLASCCIILNKSCDHPKYQLEPVYNKRAGALSSDGFRGSGLASMWLAVFADVGVMIIAVLNAIRALFVKNNPDIPESCRATKNKNQEKDSKI